MPFVFEFDRGSFVGREVRETVCGVLVVDLRCCEEGAGNGRSGCFDFGFASRLARELTFCSGLGLKFVVVRG